MKFLAILLTIIFSIQAQATGETWCTVDLGDKKVELYLVNSHSPGSSVMGGEAKVTYDNKINAEFTYQDMVGWWSWGDELKAHFLQFADGNDKFDTQLIITANYSDVHETFLGMADYRGPQGEAFQEIVQCELN